MRVYQDYLKRILAEGTEKTDRTGTGTISIFGAQMRFDLSKGFPLLTTKKVHMKSIVHELLWFLKGSTNTKYLKDNGVTIWDEWASESGDLGPVYGKQWRSWTRFEREESLPDGRVVCRETQVDQIEEAMRALRETPDSRRIIVSAWNPSDIPDMALPPCHAFFQFYVANGRLSCQLYQRSVDSFLGLPFNIASYSLLTEMMAKQAGLLPGDFVWTGGDCHIYLNHLEQVKTLLSREPRELPKLVIENERSSLFDYVYEDFRLEGYDPHPAISAPVAV